MSRAVSQPTNDSSMERKEYYGEFMDQVLGIPPDTPLADVRQQTILAAGRAPGGPHASILFQAAREASILAMNSQPPSAPASTALVLTRRVPPTGPLPLPKLPPGVMRTKLDQIIINLHLPPGLLSHVQPVGKEAITGSGNYRADFSHWAFGRSGEFCTLPSNAPNIVEALFREARELNYVGSQIMFHTEPYVIRVTFRNDRGAWMFKQALTLKAPAQQSMSLVTRQPVIANTQQPKSSPPSLDTYCAGTQYPQVTSYQAAASALIDSYRPSTASTSAFSHREPSNQRGQQQNGSSRQDPENKNAANQLLLEYGRLSPAPVGESMRSSSRPASGLQGHYHGTSASSSSWSSPPVPRDRFYHEAVSSGRGFKRDAGLSDTDTTSHHDDKRPHPKRLRAADFIDQDNLP